MLLNDYKTGPHGGLDNLATLRYIKFATNSIHLKTTDYSGVVVLLSFVSPSFMRLVYAKKS